MNLSASPTGSLVTRESAPVVERYAREKAWRDFLGQVLFSAKVWELDADVRATCEPVTDWLRRCREDLDRWVPR